MYSLFSSSRHCKVLLGPLVPRGLLVLLVLLAKLNVAFVQVGSGIPFPVVFR